MPKTNIYFHSLFIYRDSGVLLFVAEIIELKRRTLENDRYLTISQKARNKAYLPINTTNYKP